MSTLIRLEAGSPIRLDDGRRLTLGKLLKSGGAGSVFLLPGANDLVAKVYHDTMDLALYERKVAAMLQHAPDLPDLESPGDAPGRGSQGRIVQIAWPRSLLRDAEGRFRGFTMPKIDIAATIELEYVLQERQARAEGLPTGLGARLTLATNLSALLAALHGEHYFVVDLKPLNVRFYRQSLYLAMLDCDGFSVYSPGGRFPAPQFTAEYFAPELQTRGLNSGRGSEATEEAQDRFAFAVIAFQLLNFGIHPYSGQPVDERVPTDLPSRIAGNFYAYGVTPHPRIRPSRVSGHALMPVVLRALFDRAFGPDPARRPSAQEWLQALTPYALRSAQLLKSCAADASHQHYAGLACAACARLALIGQMGAQAAASRKTPPQPRPAVLRPPAAPPLASTPRASQKKRRKRGKRGQSQAAAPAPTPAALLHARYSTNLPLAAVNPMAWLRWLAGIVLVAFAVAWIAKACESPPTAAPLPGKTQSLPVARESFRPWGERADAQIDALLRAAVARNAATYRERFQRLSETARHPPHASAERAHEARLALAEYRESFVKRGHTGVEQRVAMLDRQRLLERAYEAYPYQSALAAELGLTQLIEQRLSREGSTDVATLQARLEGRIPPANDTSDALPTLRRAVALDPAAASRWSALALGCLHHQDTQCAEGAFAIGVVLQAESTGVPDTASVVAQQRTDLTERYFGGEDKAALLAAKARGAQHAVLLGGAATADLAVVEGAPSPGQVETLAGTYVEGSGLIPLCVNAHYRACGLLDRQGAWRVMPRFSEIKENAGGWAVKSAAGAEGLLDREGQELIAPLWADLGRFESGLLSARTGPDGLYGYVDGRGRWVIEPQFMYPAAFNRHAALVWVPGKTPKTAFEERRMALVNPEGELTFLPYSDNANHNDGEGAMGDGRFVVMKGDERPTEMGVIDDTGRVRVPLAMRQRLGLLPGGNWFDQRVMNPGVDRQAVVLYSGEARKLFAVSGDEAHMRTHHPNGYAVFTDAAGHHGLLNVRTGQVSIAPSSRLLGRVSHDGVSFSERSDGPRRYGYLDLQGSVLIAPASDTEPEFDRGLAVVCESRPGPPTGRSVHAHPRQRCRVIDSRGRALDAFTRLEAHHISLAAWGSSQEQAIARDIVRVERRRELATNGRPPALATTDGASASETLLTTRSGEVLVRVQTDPRCDLQRVVNARGEIIWPLDESALCELKEAGRTLPVGARSALINAFGERAAFEAAETRDRLRLRLRSHSAGQ